MHIKRSRNYLIGFIVLSLLLIGVMTVAAQDDDPAIPPNLDAEYLGANVCQACHGEQMTSWEATAHASMIQEAGETNILGDLSDEAAPTITWPDGDSSPLSLEDIDYVIGGRYVQRYIHIGTREDGSEAYYVLPVQWNVDAEGGAWSEYQPDTWTEPAQDWRTSCAGCHVTGLTTALITGEEGWVIDDLEVNITCESCHGPGGEHIKGPSEHKMVSGADAQVCGSCHIQGMDPSGQHGYPVGYQAGMPLTEDVFIPAAQDNPDVWWPTGQAKTYNAYAEWASSAHAEADVSCQACHVMHPALEEGAEAPDALLRDEPNALCQECHAADDALLHPVWEMFQGVALVTVEGVEARPSTHYTVMGDQACTTCHMVATVQIGEYGAVGTHTMQIVWPTEAIEGQADSCSNCHENAEPFQTIIQNSQAEVSARLDAIGAALEGAADVPMWVQDAYHYVVGDGSLGAHNRVYAGALLSAVEQALGIGDAEMANAPNPFIQIDAKDPDTCGECHPNAQAQWQQSLHAVASLTDTFSQEWGALGNPGLCTRCHASGYDPDTGAYAHEGVVCTSCHYDVDEGSHPPGGLNPATTSETCGNCHNGAHAPTYDEWLDGPHNEAGVSCVDCHNAHITEVQDDVNALCTACHSEASIEDSVHGHADLTCADCHMTRVTDDRGIYAISTGHGMTTDPETCNTCHPPGHSLAEVDAEPVEPIQQLEEQIEALEAEIAQLKGQVEENSNAGYLGGVIGMLLVVIAAGIIFWVLRVR